MSKQGVLPQSIGPIQEPSNTDVLLGRGGSVNEHSGNLQMRGFCVEIREEYRNAKKSNKSAIAYRVVQRIRGSGGKFLKQDKETKLWWDIGDEQAKRKVSQALRESTPNKEEWHSTVDFIDQSLSSESSSPRGPAQDKHNNKPTGQTILESQQGLHLLSHVSHGAELQPSLVASSRDDMKRKYPSPQKNLVVASAKEMTSPPNGEEDDNLFNSVFGEEFCCPQFTEEQERTERMHMTEEERLDALADIFGHACENVQRQKKVKRNANDALSLSSRLAEMRAVIGAAPVERKKALVEAMAKASPAEFADDRMALFLRREDMDATLAANRFMKYWTRRRELFGADKFHLPLTQNGALRDDKAALAAGVFSIVPKHDASGRSILLYSPHRNVHKGYDRDSLLRATWYVFEALLEEESTRKGVVFLSSWNQVTLFEYEQEFEKGFFEFERLHLPIKFRVLHGTGFNNSAGVHVFKPNGFAVMSKEIRARVVLTPLVAGEALLDHLTKYGLSRDVVPVDDMGGNCHVDYEKWLDKRRLENK